MFDVLEHIQDPVHFLDTLPIKKGGYLFITVPALPFLFSNEDIALQHYRRFTKKTLKNALEQAHFTTIYSNYFFSLLVFPIFFFRTLPHFSHLCRKSKIKKTKADPVSSCSIGGKLINFINHLEFKRLQKEMEIPFGSSIILVAQKM